MEGICKLLGVKEQLSESHIYPKFTIDYFKSTGSNYLRNFSKPNLRKQDGLKFHMLSRKAEQMFGDREKWFSQKVFYPHMNEKLWALEYDENLFYFSISFLWRILIMQLNFSSTSKDLDKRWFYSQLIEVEEKWRNFLKSYTYPSTYDRVYLHLTDNIIDHNLPFGGVDYYFTRQLDSTIVYSDDGKFLAVYGKFLKFVFWGIIIGEKEEGLKELRVYPTKGNMVFPQSYYHVGIDNFYWNRINQIESLPKASEAQQEKILQEIKKNPEAFINSDAWRAIANDMEMVNRRKAKE